MTTDSPTPFRLFLLRHARAAWALPGQSDFDRMLDDTGYAEAERIADRIADLRLLPDRIICSTAVRCRQTVEPWKRALSEDLDISYVDDLYTGDVSVYRDIVSAQSDVASVLLVGHNPMIEELLRLVVGHDAADQQVGQGYPPAGLAIIDISDKLVPDRLPTGILAQWHTSTHDAHSTGT